MAEVYGEVDGSAGDRAFVNLKACMPYYSWKPTADRSPAMLGLAGGLPSDGDYLIRVSLVHEARRGGKVAYTVTVASTPGTSSGNTANRAVSATGGHEPPAARPLFTLRGSWPG